MNVCCSIEVKFTYIPETNVGEVYKSNKKCRKRREKLACSQEFENEEKKNSLMRIAPMH